MWGQLHLLLRAFITHAAPQSCSRHREALTPAKSSWFSSNWRCFLQQELVLCCSKALDVVLPFGTATLRGRPCVKQGAATPTRCSSSLSMVTRHWIPKIHTAGKSSIEDPGNSPGWSHSGFGKVRDVSRLVWSNHKLQVWHWGRDASV